MRNDLTITVEMGAKYYVALCEEIPLAHGQGGTPEEARADLLECVQSYTEEDLPADGAFAFIPRHEEIDDVIVDRICDHLGVPRMR